MPPLGVADNHVIAELLKLGRPDLTGRRDVVLPVRVLRPHLDRRHRERHLDSSMNGTGRHECAAIVAGVEWSPVTISTSGSSSTSESLPSFPSSSFATLRSKSPSSPAVSVYL